MFLTVNRTQFCLSLNGKTNPKNHHYLYIIHVTGLQNVSWKCFALGITQLHVIYKVSVILILIYTVVEKYNYIHIIFELVFKIFILQEITGCGFMII